MTHDHICIRTYSKMIDVLHLVYLVSLSSLKLNVHKKNNNENPKKKAQNVTYLAFYLIYS